MNRGNARTRQRQTAVNDPVQILATYRKYRFATIIGSLLSLILLAVVVLAPVPYLKFSPGPMFNTIGSVDGVELVQISGTTVYPTSGQLDMTTVTERGGPIGGLTLPEALWGWLDPDQTVAPVSAYYAPDTTADQANQENAADFSSSQSSAIAASLGYLKIAVTTQVLISSVLSTGPANGNLQAGDIAVAVNGKKVSTPTEFAAAVRAGKPGSVGKFDILRDSKPQKVKITLGANPQDPKAGYIGVSASTDFRGPFPIKFGLDNVGGPSAGLMFTLAIIDKLTPENLADGKFVAGTGTISPDGKVGPIGGIAQKMFAARDQGSQLFLAPVGNCKDVLQSAPPELNVAKVATVSDAMDVLTKWRSGSNDLPRCTQKDVAANQ